jgi:hypothetical protein
MNHNPVGWFEIYVQDMDRARKFYEGVLGCELQKLPNVDLDMMSFPMVADATGASGALVHAEGVPSGGNSTMVYFSCANCADEESRVAQYGGRVERSKMSIGEYGFVSIAYDPDGNRIGLHSRQ